MLKHALATTLLFQYAISASMAVLTSLSDESSLLALKSSISHDPHNIIAANWSDSTPFCSWIGVICSKRHNRITSLNISHMNLQGVIPPQLGNLSFLVSLNMNTNRFHGNLPDELAKLSRLKSIDFGSNNLTGSVPSFFNFFPNLQTLDLSNNEFYGTIPISVGNISQLQILSLGWNVLEGNIPEEICNLRNLRHLNFDSNQLTGGIPPCIFNLTALRRVGFTSNKLTGKLPEDLCDNLHQLEGLHLSDNEFEGPIPASLQKCYQLRILSLSVNNFFGKIPKEIGNLTRLTILHVGMLNLEGEIPREIGALQKLEVFGLNQCGLGGSIPETIFNISALQILTMVDNFFTGIIPANIGRGTPNLQELYMGMNKFRGTIPESLSNASKLTVLDLSNNTFIGLIPDWIGNFNGLQLLQLARNQFSSSSDLSFLTFLTKCRRLNELAISGNYLNGRLPTSVGNLSDSLTIFSAQVCGITGEIPEEIGNLSSVARLGLSGNELRGIIPVSFGRLKKIQQLYLQKNSLTGSFPDELCSLQNLGLIRLSSNQISGPLPECIGNRTSLRYLYLDSNRFSSSLPSGIWSLNNLLQFNTSSNELSGRLPLEIGKLKSAVMIDLSTNMLSGNIPTAIGDLQSLMYLYLDQNRLEGHIPDSFGRILSLEGLDLSQNNLTGEIPKSLEAIKYLTYFNVSFNELTGEIPNGGPFANFTSQSFMSNEALCGSPLFHVPPCQFRSPTKSRRKRKKVIVMCTTLGVASMVVLSLLVLVCIRCRRKRQDETQIRTLDIVTFPRMSYDELKEATNGFSESNVVGMGSYSCVYKGRLRDGDIVAVKVFNMELEGAFKSFDTECEVLCSLRHRNLTKVISSCTSADFRALILEYKPNGSLEKWLYSDNYFLDMSQRLNIMIDVGCALDYLHNGYTMPVVHCDLKPSNVLLDEELVGYVTDFGISKMLGAGEDRVQTKTFATIGYIAPEYGVEGLVSTRSDTYSFGVLLMETFTRRKPSDEMFCGALSLRQWIMESLPSGITSVVDCNLLIQEEYCNYDAKVDCLLAVMEVGLKCSEELGDMRISIKDAVSTLNKIKLKFLATFGKS